MLDHRRLLLCYDGSGQATQALEFAAALFPHGTRATVLYAWEPTAPAAAGGMAAVAIPPDADQQDEARAARLAEAGSQHARDLGLDAEVRNEPATASAWRTVVDVSSPFGRGSRHGAPRCAAPSSAPGTMRTGQTACGATRCEELPSSSDWTP
jgi:Universal stress protein family